MSEYTTIGEALEGVDRVMVPAMVETYETIPVVDLVKTTRWLHTSDPVTVEGNRIMDMDGKLICEIADDGEGE